MVHKDEMAYVWVADHSADGRSADNEFSGVLEPATAAIKIDMTFEYLEPQKEVRRLPEYFGEIFRRIYGEHGE